MHNNIMTAGSRDRPPMLATGRCPQWQSRFLRYIDTRPNSDALSRDGNKTRNRWGPDPQTRIDWGIPELTGDGDGESPNYDTGDGAGIGIT
ncbi:hypothetical protein Tco_1159626 [Tanacetum coccineum]